MSSYRIKLCTYFANINIKDLEWSLNMVALYKPMNEILAKFFVGKVLIGNVQWYHLKG